MLPLALAVLLCAALAFQALAGGDIDLPPGGAVRGATPAGLAATQPPPVIPDPAIAARSMFTPIFTAPKDAAAPQSPLGAYAVVGAITVGRATFAVAQGPGGRTFRVGPGQRIGDWRVRGVTRDEVRLSRGGEQISIRFDPSGPVTTVSKGI